MDFHDFLMILGNLAVETDHPPKMCADLPRGISAPALAAPARLGTGEGSGGRACFRAARGPRPRGAPEHCACRARRRAPAGAPF